MTGDVDTSATHNILLEIQYIQAYSGCTYSTKIALDKVLQCGLRICTKHHERNFCLTRDITAHIRQIHTKRNAS